MHELCCRTIAGAICDFTYFFEAVVSIWSQPLGAWVLSQDKGKSSNTTLQVTGAVGWRSEGIKHKKNEVFLDIIEQVNLLVSNKGKVQKSMDTGPCRGSSFICTPESDRMIV